MTADSEESSACKALWLAFIDRMIMDACGVNCTDRERQQAHDYLFRSSNPHFSEVCSLIDLAPDYVRTAARKRVDASGVAQRGDQPVKNKREKLNLRNTVVTIDGRTMPFVDWLKEARVNKPTVYSRIHRGWSIEEALFTPVSTINTPGVGQWPCESVPDRSFPTAQDTL